MNNLLSLNCPHFSICPGCEKEKPFYGYPILYQRACSFFNKEIAYVHGNPTFWRTRGKLACRYINGAVRFGIFQKGTHELISIPQCTVHHPSINRAVLLMESICNELGKKSAYDEKSHTGLIRYLQCSVERSSGKVQLALMLSSKKESNSECAFIASKLEERRDLIHSLWYSYNCERTNRIYGDEWDHIFGPKYIWEEICGKKFPYLPSHFIQSNPLLFEKLLVEIGHHLEPDAHLIELYAGMGIISLALREKVASTISIESNKESYSSFCLAKELFPEELQKTAELIIGDSEKTYLSLEKGVHTLLVDPPRKGLSEGLITFLSQAGREQEKIKKIVYISCHYPTLESDLSKLLESDLWRLSHMSCYHFFPGTEHIETLAILDRN